MKFSKKNLLYLNKHPTRWSVSPSPEPATGASHLPKMLPRSLALKSLTLAPSTTNTSEFRLTASDGIRISPLFPHSYISTPYKNCQFISDARGSILTSSRKFTSETYMIPWQMTISSTSKRW
ncbi:Unknown protein [Scheffersomyces stipitis CBS 6054]|uniref:Uncharacterized protein n=1 Tax=Scheffersomyces stipitis (strain ATCC 58785 / CBS 6054 / NBRC 10063 / NRRL Y-11545) TaxID=322104 RepID=A3LSK5_PICST|nr:Unknown protein [Scheffersomyces stipitis CBS 6054]ABN65917.2 Unknown protein [Scheffersomyces stipitis CBS 6054]